jgi:hypothetical protein
VRYEDNRKFSVVPKLKEFLLHAGTRQCVEGRERLVHQQDLRFHRHSASDRDALLHTTRESMRIAVGEFGQLHFFDEVHSALTSFAPGEFTAGRQREGDILFDGLPRQKLIELLEDEDTVGSGGGDSCPVEKNAAFDWANVSAHRFQDCRLAAAGGSEDDESIRLQDVETDTPGGGDQVVACAVLKRDAFHLKQR